MGFVIGIGGVSRSGKGTLCKKIRSWLPGKVISTIHMDEYVYPENEIPKIRDETDWEIPESVNFTRLATSIAEKKNQYDIILVEGIMIFYDPKLVALFDRKIFVEIDYDTFMVRKRQDQRWKIPEWYYEHIWTSYIINGKVHTEGSLVVDGQSDFDKDKILDFLKGVI